MAHELAQFNVARPVAPLDSDVMVEFMGALDRVDALAEEAPGFLWRLQDDYKSGHVEYLKRRREWFERIAEAYVVLWCEAFTFRQVFEPAKATA